MNPKLAGIKGWLGALLMLSTLTPQIVRADASPVGTGEVRSLFFGEFANLGDIPLGFSRVLLIPVQSDGNAPVNIDQFSVLQARAPLVQILADGCANKRLEVGRICRVAVAYTPPSVGSFSGTVVAESDANFGDTQRLTLFSGAASGSVKALELSSYGLEFGALAMDASNTLEIDLTSIGDAAVAISAISIGGGDNFDFGIIRDECSGETLATNQSCLIGVEFSPLAPGLRTASITVISDVDSESSLQAYLAGTGDTLFRNGFENP